MCDNISMSMENSLAKTGTANHRSEKDCAIKGLAVFNAIVAILTLK